MTQKDFYRLLYRVIGTKTPIKADCGRLCSKSCCEGDKDGDGMYLFPYEEKMYAPLPSWAKISKTSLKYGDNYALLFSCGAWCERDRRPLACRIFPLAPYVSESGEWSVIVDKRARGMCPMAALEPNDFDPGFVESVGKVMNIMRKNETFREFLWELSRVIDEADFLG